MASETAWEGIFTYGHLEKGQSILIHGGAGAVGAYAVQLASRAGATVIATASGDDEAYVKSIGARRVINFRQEQFEKVLGEKVDVVFDLIGGDTQRRSFLVLKEGGHLISATQPVSQEETARYHVSGEMMRLAPSADMLGRIARLWKRGRYGQTSRPCTRSRMRSRPGRTSLGSCQVFMECRPGRRARQDAGHMARSCFACLRHLQGHEWADPSLIRGGAVQANTMSNDLLWWTSALKTAREG